MGGEGGCNLIDVIFLGGLGWLSWGPMAVNLLTSCISKTKLYKTTTLTFFDFLQCIFGTVKIDI